MRKLTITLVSCAAALCAASAHAAISMTPLSSFGGGDGWLAPGEGGYAFLGTGNNERGLAYGNGHVYLVSRSGGTFVRMLDPVTGADVGSLDTTGITGGTFALNAIGVGGDGAIYAANLTTATNTSAYKVYKWSNEAATPVVAYTGDSGLAGARIGDTLAVIGSGASTRLVAGYGSTPAVAGNNSYALVDPTGGTAAPVAFTGTPPNGGDFRLGITFADSSHVIGAQGITGVLYRYTSFSGTTGTLLASPANSSSSPNNTGERLMAYAVVGGVPLLAMQSTSDSHVSIYDMTDPTSPVFLTAGNNTSGSLMGNANGSGQMAWNVAPDGMSATLYAMSTNQGIQAFNIVVPEPGTTGLAALGLIAAGARRRNRI